MLTSKAPGSISKIMSGSTDLSATRRGELSIDGSSASRFGSSPDFSMVSNQPQAPDHSMN
jgi:hypothetical protein